MKSLASRILLLVFSSEPDIFYVDYEEPDATPPPI